LGQIVGGLTVDQVRAQPPHLGLAATNERRQGQAVAALGGPQQTGELVHSQLAVALPDPLTRALVATTLGIGVGLIVSGLRLARPRRTGPTRLPGALPRGSPSAGP
jgi:hypothetical protein